MKKPIIEHSREEVAVLLQGLDFIVAELKTKAFEGGLPNLIIKLKTYAAELNKHEIRGALDKEEQEDDNQPKETPCEPKGVSDDPRERKRLERLA